MYEETSTFRLYLMRLLYLLNFVLLGSSVWPAIFNHAGEWDPVKGVAFSFWAALSALSVLGLRYPLKMLPLLLSDVASLMADSSGTPDVVRRPLNRARQGHGYGDPCAFYGYPLT